ncbi:MAG: DUF1015 domain-containing protein [Proteobacteria bacterium]|nr:DUF1015 domain-containing protein [Pseudomonadota bacterium]
MASIRPFHGILYDSEKIPDLSLVATPPYDVISPEMREDYYRRHENNIIRLILGKGCEGDTDQDNPHTRAGAYLSRWLTEGVLARDPEPALYLTSQTFDLEGRPVTRLGLLAAVRLSPFEEGVIRPHEKTFSKVKSERLALMRQTRVNDSPVFALCPDPDQDLFAFYEARAAGEPDRVFTDDTGQVHRMWRLGSPEDASLAASLFADRCLVIADGHHRYETALNFMRETEAREGSLPEDHPARFVMIYLCSMADPGLVILPAHRMVHRLPQGAADRFFEQAGEFFDLRVLPEKADSKEAAREITRALAVEKDRVSMAAVFSGRAPVVLTVKDGVMDRLYGDELPGPVRGLDVTVLARLVFMDLLSLTAGDLDDATLMHYTVQAPELVEKIRSGVHEAGFVLNPTGIQDVRQVAEAGFTMPRKSTYFFPKAITGLAMKGLE